MWLRYDGQFAQATPHTNRTCAQNSAATNRLLKQILRSNVWALSYAQWDFNRWPWEYYGRSILTKFSAFYEIRGFITVFTKARLSANFNRLHIWSQSYPCVRPWRSRKIVRHRGSHILWTVGLQMVVKLSALLAGRPLACGIYIYIYMGVLNSAVKRFLPLNTILMNFFLRYETTHYVNID
jgi:hypothetical protein